MGRCTFVFDLRLGEELEEREMVVGWCLLTRRSKASGTQEVLICRESQLILGSKSVFKEPFKYKSHPVVPTGQRGPRKLRWWWGHRSHPRRHRSNTMLGKSGLPAR